MLGARESWLELGRARGRLDSHGREHRAGHAEARARLMASDGLESVACVAGQGLVGAAVGVDLLLLLLLLEILDDLVVGRHGCQLIVDGVGIVVVKLLLLKSLVSLLAARLLLVGWRGRHPADVAPHDRDRVQRVAGRGAGRRQTVKRLLLGGQVEWQRDELLEAEHGHSAVGRLARVALRRGRLLVAGRRETGSPHKRVENLVEVERRAGRAGGAGGRRHGARVHVRGGGLRAGGAAAGRLACRRARRSHVRVVGLRRGRVERAGAAGRASDHVGSQQCGRRRAQALAEVGRRGPADETSGRVGRREGGIERAGRAGRRGRVGGEGRRVDCVLVGGRRG